MKTITSLLILSILTLCFFGEADAAHELRTWQAKDGTESVEGTYRRVDGTIVTIMLPTNRTMQIPLENLSDADVLYVEAAQNGGDSPAATQTLGSLGEKLAGNLVDDRGRAIDPGASEKGTPKFYLMYYSASWCPPCREYTPELVRWTNRARANLGVETVLVPSDKSEEEMFKYMRDYRMRFPALKFDSKAEPWVPKSTSGGIPALVLVDSNGERLLSTAETSRSDFLREVETLLSN